MTLTVTIATNPVTLQEGSLELDLQINSRSTCKFNVVDSTGVLHILNGQQLTVTDSILGLLFAGFIDTSEEDNQSPSSTNIIQVTAKDNHYLADKRLALADYTNMLAGDIVTDLLATVLSAEGVTSGYAYRSDRTQTAFAQGTLSGTTAQDNITPGDLELSLAGTSVSHTDQTATDFGQGFLSPNVAVSGNALALNSHQGIKITATCVGNQGNNSYKYWKIWTGSYTIQSGDSLNYYVWVNATSPQIMSAVDGTFTNGKTMRDFTYSSSPIKYIVDQNHFRSHPNTDLKGWADNQWYYRTIDLTPLAGLTLNTMTVVFEGDSQGNYTTYFHDILIQNGGSTSLTVYSGGSLQASAKAQDIGYNSFLITTTTVYDQIGYRLSPAYSISSVGIIQTSLITLASNLAYNYPTPLAGQPANPTNLTTVIVSVSLDNGATWLPATDHQLVPGLLYGASASSISIMTQTILSIIGPDPTITPAVTGIEWTVNPSYSATKNDYLQTYASSTSFNTGTYSNTQFFTTQNAGTPLMYEFGPTSAVTLQGVWRDWDLSTVSSQSVYGNAGVGQFAYNGLLQLNTNFGSTDDVRSKFTFAGTWQNFTMSIDVQIVSTTNENIGVVYRTNNWVNTPDCVAYTVEVYTTQMMLTKGPDSGTTASRTVLSTVTGLTLNPGEWHTIKLVINGSNHQIFLDEVPYINVNDSSHTGSGYVGVRAYNNSTVNGLYFFNNFGIVNSLTGTWSSPSTSLSSIGSVYNTQVTWYSPVLTSGASIVVQISVDGGSTFQPVTNAGSIPQLPNGTATSGMNLVVQVVLTSANANTSPAINGLTIWIASSYNSTGTRITPSLSLTSVTPRSDNSSCTWSAQLGTGNTLFVDTSIDGGTSWQNVETNGGSIPGITAEMYLSAVTHNLPLAYYQCDEATGPTLYDTTLNAYNATVNGTVTYSQTGSLQGPGEAGPGALLFDGSTGYVTLPSGISTNGWTAFSFECWIKLTNTTYTNQLILAANDTPSSSHHGFSIAIDKSGQSRAGQFILGTGSSSTTLNFGSNQLSANVWYHLVCVYDNVHMTVYLNGVQSAQTTASGGIGNTSNQIYLMRSPSGSVYFPGTLDSVSLFNAVLATSDVSNHYNAGISTGAGTYLDFFQANTSGSYVQTYYGASGSNATWTWDTTNARLTAVSGTQSILQYPSSVGTDMYIEADLNKADQAGLFVRMVDKTDLYYAFICDSSASANAGTVSCYKMVSGTVTTLLAPTALSSGFSRGDWHRFRLDIQGYVLKITMDGTVIQTITDGGSSISAPGIAGFIAGTTSGQTSTWYSMRVHMHGKNVSALSLLSRQRLASTNPIATPQVLNVTLAVRNNQIQPGVVIPTTNFAKVGSKMDTIAKCLDTLASSCNGFLWYISNSKQLYFQQSQTTPAPYYLWSGSGTNGGNIIYGDAAGTKPKLVRNDMLYRNRQTVDGGNSVQLGLVRNFTGNGETTNWTLDYPVDSLVSISLNGVAKLFGVQGTDTGKDFYFTQGSQVISQDASEIPVPLNYILTITYNGQVPVRVTVNNTSAQTAIAAIDGTSGIVEDYVSVPNISNTTATTLANGLLQQYGSLGRIFEGVTSQYGLLPGQLASVNIPQHQLVNVPMLIDKVTMKCRIKGDGTLLWFFDAEMTEGPILGDWGIIWKKIFTATGF